MATTENLKEAFAGESQANRTYLAFAKKAEAEGFKQIAKLFKALGIERTCCLATAEHDPMVYRSARNIDRCVVTTVRQLNAWDIMQKRTLLVTKDGLQKLLA